MKEFLVALAICAIIAVLIFWVGYLDAQVVMGYIGG